MREARLPILWLFLGPPVFRLATRGADASLDGSIDLWNIIRILWWVAFGVIALIDTYRLREYVRLFLRHLRTLPWWVATWLGTLILSASYSPSPLLTLSHAMLMVILVLAAFDMGVKLYAGVLAFDAVMRRLFVMSLTLVAIGSVTYAFMPELVGAVPGGSTIPRIRGGVVADIALLAQILFFVGYYLASTASKRLAGLYVSVVVVSPVFLLVAQTRAMFGSFAIGLGLLLLGSFTSFGRRHCYALIGSTFLMITLFFTLSLYEEVTQMANGPLAMAETFVVRDRASIQGLNARAGLTAFLFERLEGRLFGLGYSAGPRLALLTSPEDLLRHGIHHAFAGNAHSIYLEVFAGTGYPGIISFVAVLLLIGWRIFLGAGKRRLILGVLFAILLVTGVTESSGILPFTQSATLLWFVAACATNLAPVRVGLDRSDRLDPRAPDFRLDR